MAYWQEQANCRGMNPEVFFPVKGHNVTYDARLICEPCEVKAECLELGFRETIGIWGGTTVRDRRRLRKQRQQVSGR
jgi:WhiB family redox-sensing transcriptional regulator